jgi:hypothetical protein
MWNGLNLACRLFVLCVPERPTVQIAIHGAYETKSGPDFPSQDVSNVVKQSLGEWLLLTTVIRAMMWQMTVLLRERPLRVCYTEADIGAVAFSAIFWHCMF